MKILTIATISLSALTLSACAMTQATIDPNSERSVARSFRDISSSRAIKSRMLRVEGFDLNDISIDVDQGIVVLAGAAPREEDKIEAERIAWSAPGVTQVGNEIYVGKSAGLLSKTKDDLISTKVRTRLAASNKVRNLNYSIETREGIVYLLGVARNQEELAEAARLASITRGVQEVVSYATIKGEMPNSFNAVPKTSTIAYKPQESGEDLEFWGEPSTDLPDTSAYSTIPYKAPNASYDDYAERAAPMPYRPGITELKSDTMGPTILDSDAIESGEPYFVDPKTGKRIELPEGVTPIPYVPDMGPGSLGSGAAPLPPGAVPSQVLQVSDYQTNGQQTYFVPAATQAQTPQAYDRTTRTYEVDPALTPEVTQAQPNVIWNGSAWVLAAQ